ncbi:MAG TPA: DUF3500 domain-containing protein [Chloroflexota bacterium]|nr:DUF3500 domain-containing protein [Chloroflexota bacterium]
MAGESAAYRPRPRPPGTAARHIASPAPRLRERAQAAVAEPFVGVTADGRDEPGLFPIRATGASTEPMWRAAEAYLGSLSAEQRGARKAGRGTGTPVQSFFAWAGECGDESVSSYRVQSPVLLIEFDHQAGIALDNDVPTRTHIHTVVRTPNGNDSGRDILRQHVAARET